MQPTSPELAPLVSALRNRFRSRETLPIPFRKRQLQALGRAVEAFERPLLDALREDLGKPEKEAYVSELAFVLSDIRHALRHLSRWAKPGRRRTPLLAWPASGSVVPQPYGVVLIIGPWNYPFQLLFSPLVGAIAAGNCVCLKPPDLAPNTSAVISRMVRDTFPADYVTAVPGSRETVHALIDQGFDYVFFTGSPGGGREVMKTSARHLTPVTLELGGKNPCIVCRDAGIEIAARRIVWGKFLNAGQTCVAPDYVLVDAVVKNTLIGAMEKAVREFYGDSPRESPDYGRIVNRRHFSRLVGYLGEGRIVAGGDSDESDLYIAPTIMTDVDPEAAVMKEEIFGPVLPVVGFDDLNSVITEMLDRPKPLAMYLFTRDRRIERRFTQLTASGGLCINDTISHILGKDLPFGGVGASGMGAYRGKATFDTLSHSKAVLRRWTWPDTSLRYPPVTMSLRVLKKASRFLLWR
jgi:aldehyde dehydrogenase (NAD+)